jgi:2-iminobutanoate/2-iminopropanoate deaminase
MKLVNTQYSQKSPGHYSAGVISGNLLFISGQLSRDPATGLVPPDGIVPETQKALDNVELVLKAAGLSRQDVVMCRVYVPGIEYWDQVNDVYARFFGTHKPARVVVPTTDLHGGCLVEIEAVAEIRN